MPSYPVGRSEFRLGSWLQLRTTSVADLYWMRIFAHNLVERCNRTTRRCPRNQENGTAWVNVHDWRRQSNVGNKIGSFSAIIRDIWTNLVHTQPLWRNVPNSLIFKIQYGGGRHVEFRKNINISGLDVT